jgi:hypothetical protein
VSSLLRPLLSLYQNNRTTINRAISAAWLSGIVWLTLGELPVYPAQWRAVMAAGVLTVGLWTVEGAFYIAILVLLYPLYHISVYVMVLFLAAAILLRPVIVAHFDQTLLVVSVPLLAQMHLEAVPALWAGLLWGAGGGMWVGGLAALWFKLLGGMSGLNIDLGVLISSPLNVNLIMDRFHTANSLETLQRLVEPFAPSSTVALSHPYLGYGGLFGGRDGPAEMDGRMGDAWPRDLPCGWSGPPLGRQPVGSGLAGVAAWGRSDDPGYVCRDEQPIRHIGCGSPRRLPSPSQPPAAHQTEAQTGVGADRMGDI